MSNTNDSLVTRINISEQEIEDAHRQYIINNGEVTSRTKFISEMVRLGIESLDAKSSSKDDSISLIKECLAIAEVDVDNIDKQTLIGLFIALGDMGGSSRTGNAIQIALKGMGKEAMLAKEFADLVDSNEYIPLIPTGLLAGKKAAQ